MPRKRKRAPRSWLRYENRPDGKPKFASKEWFINLKTKVVTSQLYNHQNEDFGTWSNRFDRLIFPKEDLPNAKEIINGLRLGREEGDDDGFVNQNFTPSKRAFQTQIKRWNFPAKHVPVHSDAALVERVRQLWTQNVSQKNMLLTLHNEGFQKMTERELTRVRDRENLKLRVASVKNGKEKFIENTEDTTSSARREVLIDEHPKSELDEEVLQKRRAWHEKLEAESLERLEKRTRRRRTKEYAGLPPDPPAPPRFPSETTLEEAKNILQLDKSTYANLRAKFEEICQQHHVLKKTEAGHDKWNLVKNQLIDESPTIQHHFQVPDQQLLNHNYLALEMICNDVTKKLRTMKKTVTIADAKNVLGLNPEQGRQIKAAFHQILRDDHFTSKLEAGPEHWAELKQKWLNQVPLLQEILAPGESDSDHGKKVKAMEHLCRDVMKRLRDSQTRESKRHNTEASPRSISQAPTYDGISTLASQALASTISSPLPTRQHYTGPIDPDLLSESNYPSYPAPTPIYFRLSPTSQIKTPPAVWVATLATPTVSTLRSLAIENRPYADVEGVSIEGLIKGEGGEVKVTIGDDEELGAYLRHVEGKTPTFVVGFNPGRCLSSVR
ncbi:MAG: hypothetical protein Q9228_002710 [Teloschistes exilis]